MADWDADFGKSGYEMMNRVVEWLIGMPTLESRATEVGLRDRHWHYWLLHGYSEGLYGMIYCLMANYKMMQVSLFRR